MRPPLIVSDRAVLTRPKCMSERWTIVRMVLTSVVFHTKIDGQIIRLATPDRVRELAPVALSDARGNLTAALSWPPHHPVRPAGAYAWFRSKFLSYTRLQNLFPDAVRAAKSAAPVGPVPVSRYD